MILPDVNVLVYAYRADLDQHETYRPWLSETLDGPEPLGLPDVVLTGFMRVVTNRRIFANPSPIQAALTFVERVRAAPVARSVPATDATWREFAKFAQFDSRIVANLVPDAWIAALAVSVGARLATADAGFARFEGLKWFNPRHSADA